MAKYYANGAVIEDAREIADLSQAMVDFMDGYHARQKVLLNEWVRYLARERARDDVMCAENGFIAICGLVAVAIGFLIVL